MPTFSNESLREVFAGDLDPATAASCSIGGVLAPALPYPGVRRKPRAPSGKHRAGSTPPSTAGCPTAVKKASTPRSWLLIRRGYGFHSAEAALALVTLACGPVKLELPYDTSRHPHSWQRAEGDFRRFASAIHQVACDV